MACCTRPVLLAARSAVCVCCVSGVLYLYTYSGFAAVSAALPAGCVLAHHLVLAAHAVRSATCLVPVPSSSSQSKCPAVLVAWLMYCVHHTRHTQLVLPMIAHSCTAHARTHNLYCSHRMGACGLYLHSGVPGQSSQQPSLLLVMWVVGQCVCSSAVLHASCPVSVAACMLAVAGTASVHAERYWVSVGVCTLLGAARVLPNV
jgi:hypothetical protein